MYVNTLVVVIFILSNLYIYLMLRIVVYLVFIVSVAMAAGSIVLSQRLRNRYSHEITSTLLYYLAFTFTFGFYGIWGQVIINAFLPDYISPEILSRLSDFAILLGLPFLVFSWLMLIRFSNNISGRKNNNWHIFWFLLINFGIIVFVGYYITKISSAVPAALINSYFIVMNFLISFTSAILIRFRGKEKPAVNHYHRKVISTAIFSIMILQCLPVAFYKEQLILALIFIFVFFAGHTFLPLYFNYGILPGTISEPIRDLSFQEFCKKYEISPRETEIIKEICNGLSNKEISEKLFISLQTVKDHTHRIYIKTNVRSRVQLINMLK
jgi:DNA-binding CsgD family transcriptional regulator